MPFIPVQYKTPSEKMTYLNGLEGGLGKIVQKFFYSINNFSTESLKRKMVKEEQDRILNSFFETVISIWWSNCLKKSSIKDEWLAKIKRMGAGIGRRNLKIDTLDYQLTRAYECTDKLTDQWAANRIQTAWWRYRYKQLNKLSLIHI